MKTKLTTLITASLAVAMVPTAFALEAPADDAPPPAVDRNVVKPLRFDPPPAHANLPESPETAFLGVVTSDVPEMLAEQLDLKGDEGIIVRSLMPDGPAAKAGIAVHDIITRMDDQLIHSPADISKCVGGHKPGDKVSLEIIHKAKAAKIDVMLGSRPAGVATNEPQPMDQLNLDEFPKELADRIRGAIAGNLGGLNLQPDDDAVPQIPPQLGNAMQELKKNLEKALAAPQGLGGGGIQMQSGATIRMKDPQGSIEVRSNNGSKEVTIRDNEDKVAWSGPWDTEQDKAAAPAEVRKRVDGLNLDTDFKGNGLRFQMHPPAGPNAEGQNADGP